MSISYSRISNATVDDIIFYDPAAERRADSLDVNWDDYFRVGSQEILYSLEFGWWPKYVESTMGAWYFKNDAQGRMVTAFDTAKLLKDSQTLIRLDVFKAVEQFYSALVTDVSNINEVDEKNWKHAKARYEAEFTKAVQLSNFYDLRLDGIIDKFEENMKADAEYFTGDRRYF
jgi:hypothetical protein